MRWQWLGPRRKSVISITSAQSLFYFCRVWHVLFSVRSTLFPTGSNRVWRITVELVIRGEFSALQKFTEDLYFNKWRTLFPTYSGLWSTWWVENFRLLEKNVCPQLLELKRVHVHALTPVRTHLNTQEHKQTEMENKRMPPTSMPHRFFCKQTFCEKKPTNDCHRHKHHLIACRPNQEPRFSSDKCREYQISSSFHSQSLQQISADN